MAEQSETTIGKVNVKAAQDDMLVIQA